jgi:polar amino acid transport system ATP-binding protein
MIKINNLTKSYNNIKVVDDLSINLELGKVYSIIGPSGGGKSTFLRCVAGLEDFDSGHIDYGTIKKNEIGFIFQHFNLFTNMTVLENLIYAPQKVFGIKKDKAIKDARLYMDKVKLDKYMEDKYPANISGGQKQRVAIARALCMKPKVILYDEPTSALDPENAAEVLLVIKQLSRYTHITSIIITHHMKFAEHVAQKVLFFDNGKFIEENNPKDFFFNPQSQRLRTFLSKTDLMHID